MVMEAEEAAVEAAVEEAAAEEAAVEERRARLQEETQQQTRPMAVARRCRWEMHSCG